MEEVAPFTSLKDKMWECKQCKKIWYYPLEKCIFCKSEVINQKPKGFIVKGISKVLVSSNGHEKIPYYNLLLEDENGNLHIKKTFKEYNRGDRFEQKACKNKTCVGLSSIGYSVIDATKRAIELIGGINFNPNDKIIIKPNIVLAKNPSTGIITNPSVVEGIIQYLLKEGSNRDNILILEGSLQDVDSKKAIKKSGYYDLCQRYGIKFKDLFSGDFVTREITMNHEKLIVQISKDIMEADLIINVPVVKTHFQTGVSLGIKNMKGIINHPSRKNMHRGKLQEQIAYLNTALPKYITIADGSIGLEGMGPGALGTPANFGLIIAGKDPVAVDRIICELIGLKVPLHITKAAELGLGELDLDKIEIIGEEMEIVKRKFKAADDKISPHPDIELIDGKPCSGCLNSVWSLLYRLKDISAEEISIAFGSQISEDMIGYGKIVAIGDCALNAVKNLGREAESLRGCPPSIEEQEKFLKKWLK